ncbi:phosphonate metabolism protein/1,5-bisphosphokinase (PRPP-forming) PhnN [Zhengella sp. ZM62]|uniref:phosphonate metabolism protein/1,5-bisphosphokinase (PRPP-forming) PhnN n=1 Tax=Zhengella sedimenti TaxID=3390035 RepID=UPI0039771A33
MQGRLVVIVGPSGSGKDTLIGWLRRHVGEDAGVLFVRRVITRPADAGGEDHEAATPARFEAMEREGAFCVTWQAHGLSYGIPAGTLDHVRAGGTAVVNGSRKALPVIRAVFDNVLVILLTVDPAELRRRLGERGRETEAEIRERLERARLDFARNGAIVEVDNSGPVEAAGRRVLALMEEDRPARD